MITKYCILIITSRIETRMKIMVIRDMKLTDYNDGYDYKQHL